MKRIVNFENLNESEITTSKRNPLRFETAHSEPDNLWVFDNVEPGIQGRYCTLITMNWNRDTIDIRKCFLGEGTAGEDLETGLPLPKNQMKSMADFSFFVGDLIEHHSLIGSYKN